ncbi:MAG: PEP-CTERM sorting domain-containing protein [Leptolyngbyaceae cyanobacterium RM2_2_4]|nr:PEP-CTERM sorting domain-containing protein [Leptolyngbyaceae cyanobacterium SM1_4_3]NJN56281.1 PEP-CTERM sorting domain-containing protein [Leptolyngbyaceae cyanobacterium SL_5_9]NJO49940.1 PEP-CTERM sorting domain-containing protein [Leptolyngbyaceae cyanobacterium RM2_2_4]
MRFNQITAILGLTTAAVVSTALVPAQATAETFQVESGVTSVFLDLPLLESIGLNLTGTSDNIVPPVSDDFLVGFEITDDTDFSFSDEGGFTLIGGSIEHTGSITFNDAITVGDFSIGFDASRVSDAATGFFVQDTLDTGAILFDVASIVPTVDGEDLTIAGGLLVSPEFAGVLGNPDLTGALVGQAQTNAETEPVSVPEPTSGLMLLVAGAAIAAGRRQLTAKQ